MITRTVEIDGMIYRQHEVIWITHKLDDYKTVVRVRSSNCVNNLNNGNFQPEIIDTEYDLPFSVCMSFEQAEADVFNLPAFNEQIDPYMEVIDEITSILSDDQAVTVLQAFKEWTSNMAYNVGDRRRYDDKLYKCLQPHTSQADQTPDVAVSLWARIIASEDPDNPLPWEQPDSTNPYMKGDRVTHNGHTWESDYDNNVWEPGIYGWHIVEI